MPHGRKKPMRRSCEKTDGEVWLTDDPHKVEMSYVEDL